MISKKKQFTELRQKLILHKIFGFLKQTTSKKMILRFNAEKIKAKNSKENLQVLYMNKRDNMAIIIPKFIYLDTSSVLVFTRGYSIF